MIANLTEKRNKMLEIRKKFGKIRKNQKKLEKIRQEKLGKIWKFPNFS